MTSKKAQEKAQALEYLKWIRAGTTVYSVLRHVSRSGMYRTVDFYVIYGNRISRITWSMCRALGMRYDERHQAIGIGGCGYDVGHHAVMNLSYALHGMKNKGDGAKEKTQGRPFTPRHGHYHAGYSLNHEWM